MGSAARRQVAGLGAFLATPYFNEIKIVEEEFEPLDLNEPADLVGITMMTCWGAGDSGS